MEMWRHRPHTLAYELAEAFPALCADDVEEIARIADRHADERVRSAEDDWHSEPCPECDLQIDLRKEAEYAASESKRRVAGELAEVVRACLNDYVADLS